MNRANLQSIVKLSACQAFLFDLDGTLTDSEPGMMASLDYLVRQLGHTPDPEFNIRFVLGPPAEEWIRRVLGHYGDTRYEEGVELYRRHQSEGAVLLNSVYPQIPELLGALQSSGKRLFVATAKRTAIAERVVSHFGLRRYFDGVYGSTPDGSRNNKAVVIADLLRQQGLTGAQCAMIGDRSYDMRAASENGLIALGALWGYGSEVELSEHGAWKCFHTPQEIAQEVFAR